MADTRPPNEAQLAGIRERAADPAAGGWFEVAVLQDDCLSLLAAIAERDDLLWRFSQDHEAYRLGQETARSVKRAGYDTTADTQSNGSFVRRAFPHDLETQVARRTWRDSANHCRRTPRGLRPTGYMRRCNGSPRPQSTSMSIMRGVMRFGWQKRR